jgi:hypothetical protein
MPPVDHPSVTWARVVKHAEFPRGRIENILRVKTNMPERGSPGFDQEEYDRLEEAVAATARKHGCEGYSIETA